MKVALTRSTVPHGWDSVAVVVISRRNRRLILLPPPLLLLTILSILMLIIITRISRRGIGLLRTLMTEISGRTIPLPHAREIRDLHVNVAHKPNPCSSTDNT